jgi:hypothetical protein
VYSCHITYSHLCNGQTLQRQTRSSHKELQKDLPDWEELILVRNLVFDLINEKLWISTHQTFPIHCTEPFRQQKLCMQSLHGEVWLLAYCAKYFSFQKTKAYCFSRLSSARALPNFSFLDLKRSKFKWILLFGSTELIHY